MRSACGRRAGREQPAHPPDQALAVEEQADGDEQGEEEGDEAVGHPHRGLADGGVVALQAVGQVLDPLADLVGRARLGQVVAHHGQGLDLAHHLVEVAAELAPLADGGRDQEGHRGHDHQDQARHHRGHRPRPAQRAAAVGRR